MNIALRAELEVISEIIYLNVTKIPGIIYTQKWGVRGQTEKDDDVKTA